MEEPWKFSPSEVESERYNQKMPSPLKNDDDFDDGFDYPDDGGGGGDYNDDDYSPPPPPPPSLSLPLPFSFPKPVPIMLPKPVPISRPSSQHSSQMSFGNSR
jgi:hypothetical protein